MTDTSRFSPPTRQWLKTGEGNFTLRLAGRLDVNTASAALKTIVPELKIRSPLYLAINIEDIHFFDDFGAVVLFELKKQTEDQKGTAEIIGVHKSTQSILDRITFEPDSNETKQTPRSDNFPERLGEATFKFCSNLGYLLSFFGAVLVAVCHVFRQPKRLRLNDMIFQMEKTGVNALPIVGMISFLLGLIMAFMSSIQLKQFGANIYVASLVALAMISELGPIMTAIIVSGRSGSAFAAEIATMKVSEEIDALFTMGFDPVIFLTIPRLFAAIIVVPILTVLSNLFAITGGLVIGVTMLNLTTGSYISQSVEAITLFEILWGLFKSIVFAVLIAWTGCLRGFQARGGASAVGNAATSAVVSSIFLIILFDSVFAVIRSYWW